MKNLHIEIVGTTTGGLSSMSKHSRDAVCSVLSRHYTNVGISIVNNLADLETLEQKKPDLVFLGMKYISTRPLSEPEGSGKIWLESYLNDRGIICTGSPYSAHELEFDKQLAKERVRDVGIMTSRFLVADQRRPSEIDLENLTFPLFVKPTNRGGGAGIDSGSVVHDVESLAYRIAHLGTKLGADSLVEEYLPGREFSVAVLRDEYSEEYSAMPIELLAPQDENGNRVLSAQVKSADTEQNAEVTDVQLRRQLCDQAIDAFDALGARDYGRIDIRLDADGVPHFLEANLIPSLIDKYGNFPKACLMNMSLGYESMLLHIVRLALARYTTVVVDDERPMPLVANLLSLEPAI